jgi:transmembrane sensor
MNAQQINELLKKRQAGELSDTENAMLESWYISFVSSSDQQPSTEDLKVSKAEIQSKLPLAYPKSSRRLWMPISIAAGLLILFSVGIFLYTQQTSIEKQSGNYANDIPPGKNSATLTLADGHKIYLSEKSSGEFAKQQGVNISKAKDGKLIYTITGAKNQTVSYNTLSTTNGEQIEVLLPDGTSVWLNAASELKFPTTFAGAKNRRVELIGEGYFEVFKNKKVPFIVHTDKQEVQVLGTHFNINSYAEDADAKTTLLEGSVMINHKTVIKPGQQASGSALNITTSNIDTELAVAWKNNKFMFEQENIQGIMNRIKRWYNVEVVYSGEVSKQLYTGSVSRFANVSKVLEILELTGNVHFKIEGRRITVMK